MKSKIENFFLWRWLLKLERFFMVFCSIAVVIIFGIKVVCRYILKIDFSGSEELLIIFALWLYYSGGLYGSYEDSHIKADVLSIVVSNPRISYVINILVKAISLAVSIFLAKWAIDYLQLCLKLGGYTTVYHLPMMCSRGALIVGYTMPVLYNVYHLIFSFDYQDFISKQGGNDQL